MVNQNKSKRIFALLTIMLLVIFQVLSFSPQQIQAAALANGATILAVDQNGNKVVPLTAVEVEEGQNAFSILKELTEEHDIPFDYSIHEQFGEMINGIGEATPEYPDYWGFVVNGEEAEVGASSYIVEKGDSILFKVTSWPTEKVNVTVSAKEFSGNELFNQNVQVVKGSSAYDALILAGKKAETSIDSSIDPMFFAYVNNLGEVILGETEYWSTYLNEGYMEEGLSSTIVQEGDHIELKVESWAPPEEGNENDGTDKEDGEDNESTEEEEEDTPAVEEEENSGEEVEKDPVTKEQVNTAIQSLTQYISNENTYDFAAAVALHAVKGEVPQKYIEKLKKELVEKDGQYRNVTDYEGIVLGLTAGGYDATSFAGYDLIEKIYSNERMTNQGNNGIIYALLALDSGGYEVPDDAKWSRQKLVDYLLQQQLPEGGWSLFGSSPSIDITGMALTALAPYKSQEGVQEAIDKAVEWLSSIQDNNGGYSNDVNGGDASETTAQVIIGLSTVGADPTGAQFTKVEQQVSAAAESSESSGTNLVQHLLTFKQEDGGFSHLQGDDSNVMASTQALLALTAYDYYLADKGSIYQFSKPIEVVPPAEEKEETPVSDTDETPIKVDEKSDSDTNEKTVDNTESGNKSNEKESTNTDGHRLPDTATSLYNLLVLGGTMLIIGSSILVYKRKTNKV